MKHLDFLELPHLPNFLRFKANPEASFPISQLPDSEIRLLFKRMGEKAIQKKKAAQDIKESTAHLTTAAS